MTGGGGTTPEEATLERAALVISIDVEMSWGLIHRPDADYRFPTERERLGELLDLLDRYDVPATWAFVGHLLLDECDRGPEGPHPELVRPSYEWFEGDWLASDPCTSADEAPTWYAPDLLRDVRRRATAHEIGSHSFTHLIAGDPGCSVEAFRSDLRRCREATEAHGASLDSFIYPRNQYGHQPELAAQGFSCYRGPRPDPYAGGSPWTRWARRTIDLVAPIPATAVHPIAEHGVWNLPASYLHDVGSPRRYPLHLAQARRRLGQAVRHRSLFHVWFHPHNLDHETDRWFEGLERLLARAARWRDDGRLDTLTMGALAAHLGSPSERRQQEATA